uniref:tRNA (32-2'-O)-methyltransferase regulator THADA n=1 Tax=Salarias fasciatus TaxID=181472 RepID=A0A672GSU6_SALFA
MSLKNNSKLGWLGQINMKCCAIQNSKKRGDSSSAEGESCLFYHLFFSLFVLFSNAGSQLEALSGEQCDGELLDSCVHTLTLLYTSLQAKNPLRRAVASALASVPLWLQERTVNSLSACLLDCTSCPSAEKHPHTVDTIGACLDGFPLENVWFLPLFHHSPYYFISVSHMCVSVALVWCHRGLTGRHIAQAQLMQSCLAAVKTSMLVVQRCQESLAAALQDQSELEETLGGLLGCYTHILTDEEFIQSVQSTAGMALVLLIRSVLGSGDDIVCGLLQSSGQGLESSPPWLRRRCEGLCSSRRPAGVSLYLCHGALAMLSWKGALPGPRWEQLLLLVPNTLLDLDVSIKESSTAMVVARVLTLWSGAALDCLQGEPAACPPALQQALSGGSELQRRLLEHIYSHWEHPLDGVRHQTRSLFRNLLLLHQHAAGAGPDPTKDAYVSELTLSLLGLEWHMRGKYGSLGCLVELYGAGHLLELQPRLPSRLLGLMGDQTLAPYASDLLERLFVSHKAQLASAAAKPGSEDWMELWHQTWVGPLLHMLCRARPDQTTYILDYFLPKLLRCSPSSLAHMVKALQDPGSSCSASPSGSRGALGALMTCLRAARAQGVIPSSEGGLWGGLVPLALLQQALIHKHDQVRMDALGLVCESHRSTEVLTSEEMELIRYFLPPNLNSQSPGIRQQTVSLLKKLLCRVKDSTQLLQKRLIQERDPEQSQRDQHTLHLYKDFLRWLSVTLLDVLLPAASFSKCLMSLHLLGLLAQLFSFSTGPDVFALGEVVTSTHAQNVLYCVASNFLEVKQLASALLRQLPPSTVGLQVWEGRMLGVLQAALDLSTSTKPFDSVTAAHLLNLLLHQPELSRALLLCAQRQGVRLQPPSAPAQASHTLLLELNTLAVVQLLLGCLQSEVQKAESSLLQAASSRPLYGRAHCITAVLQNLDTRSLTHTEQWRSLVTELIAVCYRMSDVVSPVVQSSSPEGLIPMDTDSETSAGLQRILQEIQPRDTNDFFTSARQLETHQGDPQNSHTPSLQAAGGEGYRVTAQMVLVCCWRSMKEVAMLLGQLCQTLPLRCTQPGLITEEQVEGVGLYFRQQLLQSRHRGAFELAYVGFVRLTDMLCRSGSRTLQQLPARWLSEVLEEVKSSDPSSKLCATRRSAGIPFYIQALLSSEPKSSSCSLLKMTMRTLIGLATPSTERTSDSSTVPQVHALNILRALYRDTRLGENIIPFVSDGMQAAVLGFTSPVWAVRNSSTLLFSTLITRIFGVKKGKDEHSKKNRMTGREFFTRFPALYPFLLTQLEAAAATVESDSGQVKLHPSLFLLLLVLSRLYPSPMDGSSSPLGLAPFMPFIMRCGRSAVYRTREMAARALVPFVLLTQVPSTVHSLLQELPPQPGTKVQQNHIHGTLLQVLFLLRSYQADSHRPLCETLPPTHAYKVNRVLDCPGVKAAFGAPVDPTALCLAVETVASWVSSFPGSEVRSLRRSTLSVLMASELVTSDPSPATSAPGSTQYLLSLASVALGASVELPEVWGGAELTAQLLEALLRCPQYEVRELAAEGVLRRLQEEEGVLRRLQEEEEGEDKRRKWPQWLDDTTLSHLIGLAIHETQPQCLAKVLKALRLLSSGGELLWRDGVQVWSQQEVLQHLLTLAQNSTYRSVKTREVSQLTRTHARTHADSWSAVCCSAQWAALVCSCCCEEQPAEVKMMAAEVLVHCTPALLLSPHLPLGLSMTVSLWRSLLMLLQDEDQEVRDAASDFISEVPAHLLSAGVAGASVCPPAALLSGVELLCRLLGLWGQPAAGVLALTEWLLGEDGDDRDVSDEEDFLFEKGDLNLWAEPGQWVNLLHAQLTPLVQTADPGAADMDQAQQIRARAQAEALISQQALDALPALPQFSSTVDHARLTLRKDFFLMLLLNLTTS